MSRFLTLGTMVIVMGLAGISAQEKAAKETQPAKDKDKKKAESEVEAGDKGGVKPANSPAQPMTQGLGAFGQMLPMGRRNLDVQIPSFKDGVPSSVLRASSMTRVDDALMTMEQMDIWLYGKSRESDMRVQLPLADYNMTTQVLSSEERSRISRQDFQLEGDSMVFDTATQQGRMTGRVEMVIFNMNNLAPAAAEEGQAQPGEAPAGNPATGAGDPAVAPAVPPIPPTAPSATATPANPSSSNEKK